MTKTVSSRIPKDLHDRLKQRCDEDGCNTNDFIRDVLENELEQEPPKEPQKIIINDIPDKKPRELQNARIESKPTIELESKPTIELQPTPQVIIKEVLQDNSNKPVVQFTSFNGKLLPFAKRYNL